MDEAAGPVVPVKPPALGRQAARGASLVAGGQAARIIIQLVSVAILARLLDPVDYGLVAIVLAIVGVGEIVRDFGLSTAAVQAKTLSTDQRDKLLWLNTAIGAALAVAGFLAAPLVARIFGQSQLTMITQALAVTFLINGMIAQYRADLNRRMKFRPLVMSDVLAQVVGVVVAIALAWSGAGFWALVGQQLGQAVATLVILAVSAGWLPGRPRRGVDVKSMVRFGHGLMAAQFIGYLNNNVDTYTIGLTLGPGPLGIYNRGFQLLMRPLGQMRAPTTTVALPVLARLQDEPERAGQYIVRGQLVLCYPVLAMLAFAAGASTPLVDLFLGPRWHEVAPVFGLLAIAGAFETLAYVGNWVYLSRGLTGKLFWYSLISLAIKIVCVLVGSHWGIVGVAAGYAVAPGIAWPISLWWLSRLTPIPVRALTLGAVRMTACATFAGLLCLALVSLVHGTPDIVQLLVAGVLVLVVYASAALVLPPIRSDLRQVIAVVRKVRQR